MAVASGVCFTLISALNCIALAKEVGAFANWKKLVSTVLFSIPLGVLGLLCTRLLYPYTGNIGTLAVMLVFLVFFLFIFISAFDIVDICGCLKLLKPAKIATNKRKRRRENGKRRTKRA